MLIDCPACARSYHVSRADIGDGGRTVICPRCEASWFVDGDGTSVVAAAGPDLHVPAYNSHVAAMPAPDADVVDRSPAAPRRHMAVPALVVAGLLVAMGGLGARERIVKAMPRLAGLYAAAGLPVNVRGLEIEALTPERPEASPSEMTISGAIRNVAERRVVVPRLTYQIRDAAGAPLLTWSEAAPAHTLAMGRTVPFVSTPHRLPPDGHSILVRFEDADPSPPVRLARRLD